MASASRVWRMTGSSARAAVKNSATTRRVRLNFDAQTVMGEADVGREKFFGGFVSEVVTDVGQVGALCAGRRGDAEGFVEGEVAGVGFVAQGVDDEDGDVEDLFYDSGRDVMAIAEIGGEFASAAREDVAIDQHAAVRNFGGDDFHAAEFEGCGDFVGFGTDVVAEGVLSIERVIKRAPQVGHGVGRGVNGQGAVGEFTEAAEVVKAGHMVGVRVGKNGGVEPA